MNALLALEPRVASEDVIEPGIGFSERHDTLHMACQCLSGSGYYSTPTTICEDLTHFCPV